MRTRAADGDESVLISDPSVPVLACCSLHLSSTSSPSTPGRRWVCVHARALAGCCVLRVDTGGVGPDGTAANAGASEQGASGAYRTSRRMAAHEAQELRSVAVAPSSDTASVYGDQRNGCQRRDACCAGAVLLAAHCAGAHGARRRRAAWMLGVGAAVCRSGNDTDGVRFYSRPARRVCKWGQVRERAKRL